MTTKHELGDVILISADAAPVGSSPRIPDVEAETHGGKADARQGVVDQLSVEELGGQWRRLVKALCDAFQLSDEEAHKSGLQVDAVKVGLGVNADGNLFLVGKVGAKASVEITLRHDRTQS